MKTIYLRPSFLRLALFSLCAVGLLAMQGGRAAQAIALQSPGTTETAKLMDPTATLLLTKFGNSVALSGDTMAVGAPFDRSGADGGDGAVSIYVRNGATWTLQQKVYHVNRIANDGFGLEVALEGDTLVVTAPNGDIDANQGNEGIAVVFVRSNGRWAEQQMLFASDARPADFDKGIIDYFGYKVALSGNTIVISSLTGVYIFTRNGARWTQTKKFSEADAHVGSFAIYGDTLALWVSKDNESDTFVRIYTRSNGTWARLQDLAPDRAAYPTSFGAAIVITENHLVVGAPTEPSGNNDTNEGRVYVYGRSGAGWVRKQKLVSTENNTVYGFFGRTLAQRGSTLVVGAGLHSAYVFGHNGTTWSQQQRLVQSDGGREDLFCSSIATDGNLIAVGAPQHGKVSNPIPVIPGAVYLYNGTTVAARPVANVSAASYAGSALAPESIVSAFGTGLATMTQVASSPLPNAIGGTTVQVKDSLGVERMAPLFFVSPSQINYLIPAGTAGGTATVKVTSGDGVISSSSVSIEPVAAGLFTANATGRGLAAAVVLRVKADGSQSYESMTRFDTVTSQVVAVPIDLGPATDQVFLVLYGTGLRYRANLSGVSATAGGADVSVLYAGSQNGFIGLDQVNLRLPRTLVGRGEVDVTLTVDGKTANTVKAHIK